MNKKKMLLSLGLCGLMGVNIFAPASSFAAASTGKAYNPETAINNMNAGKGFIFSESAASGEMADVVKSVKNRLKISEEYVDFIGNVENMGQETIYSLTWSVQGDEEKRIYVEANSKKDIVFCYMTEDTWSSKPSITTLDEEKMKAFAESWIKVVNPSWASQLDFENADFDLGSLYSNTARISFNRIVNGVPYCDNSVSLSLDKSLGEVKGMSSTWEYDKEVPGLDKVLPLDTISENYVKDGKVTLKYKKVYGSDQAVLVYEQDDYQLTINALTGKYIDADALYRTYGGMSEEATKDSTANGGMGGSGPLAEEKSLTEQEMAEIKQMSNLISKEKAAEIAKGLLNTGLSSYTVESTRYYKSVEKDVSGKDKSQYHVSISLSKGNPNNETYGYANVTLKGENGALEYFYSYNYQNEKKSSLGKDKLTSGAEEFLKAYGGTEAKQTKLFQEPSEDGHFNYSQSVNGIEYSENNIYITVNPGTGYVTSYGKYWDNSVTFESNEGILDETAAKQALVEKMGLTLQYKRIFDTSKADAIGKPLPVYTFSNEYYCIGAKTGDILNWELKQHGSDRQKNMPKDIDKTFAKMAIEALINNDIIILEEGEENFYPNNTLTQAQALEWVGALNYRVFPLDDAVRTELYRWASSNSIIDPSEKNPDAIITREQAVRYILRACGSEYIRLAELQGIYHAGYKDEAKITKGLEGYVAFAKGLGIAGGDGSGNFRPQATVTRAEFAQMMFNFLKV